LASLQLPDFNCAHAFYSHCCHNCKWQWATGWRACNICLLFPGHRRSNSFYWAFAASRYTAKVKLSQETIFRFFSLFKTTFVLFNSKYGHHAQNLYGRLKSYLHKALFEMRVRISEIKKRSPAELKPVDIQEGKDMPKLQYLNLNRLHIINSEKKITLISEIIRNIAIFLSVVLIISLIYGMVIDWWSVEIYVYYFIYAILGCLLFIYSWGYVFQNRKNNILRNYYVHRLEVCPSANIWTCGSVI